MKSVYMRFRRDGEGWLVILGDMSGDSRMRNLTFASADKIEAMANRAGALKDLAAKQALEAGIRSGAGGLRIELTEAQFAKVSLGR